MSLLEEEEYKHQVLNRVLAKGQLRAGLLGFGPTQLSFTQSPSVKFRVKILSSWNNTN